MFANDNFGRSTPASATSTLPKGTLNKGKLQPFGSHFVTKLSAVNSKLVCSLSARAVSDCITDPAVIVDR